jgi:hypothetical protein
MNKIGNLILGLLSVALLFIAITQDVAYDFYNLLRIVLTCASGYFAFDTYKNNYKPFMAIFIIIGILFNPIAPLSLYKSTWQLIDYSVLIYFIFYSFVLNFKLIKGDNI